MLVRCFNLKPTLECPLRLGLQLVVGSDQGARDASGPRSIYVDHLDSKVRVVVIHVLHHHAGEDHDMRSAQVSPSLSDGCAGDARGSEDLDVDREPETWQKISRNATRAQHPPLRGGARLPIEANAAFFSAIFFIVHLLLVLLAGRVHDEERVEVPFRRCPKGGNPAFLDDQSQKGPLESEILGPDPDPDPG